TALENFLNMPVSRADRAAATEPTPPPVRHLPHRAKAAASDLPQLLESFAARRDPCTPVPRGLQAENASRRNFFHNRARSHDFIRRASARGGGGVHGQRLDGRARRGLVVRQRLGKPGAELLFARAVARMRGEELWRTL